ncbi:MAG TPA: Crp/Fnr family transcriptional regulator [Burkholderiaceae bacterium]|nr:Crp/Fnr family transcriptional regulator [Burkholderiaceae bacterium]
MARREIAPQAFLAALPLFKALDDATLARLAAATTARRLTRGERLFAKGDEVSGMYVVVHGEIRLIARSPVRGARLTGVVGPGRSFGEPVMFLERPAVVDAEAAGDALVLRLPKEAVFAEIERSPRFARRIIASLSQRIESLVHELDRQTLGSGRARLIDYLVRRAGNGPGPRLITLPATKAAVASQLNLTPEHFSRLLHELAASGLLLVEGRHIRVPDVQRLAGHPEVAI